MGGNFRVNLHGGAHPPDVSWIEFDNGMRHQNPDVITQMVQPCRDRGGIRPDAIFECQLPHGHTGVHKYDDAICWERTT